MTEWYHPAAQKHGGPVRRGRRKLVAAFAALVVLGAGAVMILPGLTAPTPTPAPTVAPTAMTFADRFAKIYADYTAWQKSVAAAFRDPAPGEPTLSPEQVDQMIQAGFAATLGAERIVAWPPSVQADVDQLIADQEQLSAYFALGAVDRALADRAVANRLLNTDIPQLYVKILAELRAAPVTASSAGSSTGAVPTPTPAASPSITDLPTAYTACADATNAEARRLNAQLDRLGGVTAENLGTGEAIYLKFADLEASFRFCFTGIPWPPQLQPDVQQVLAAGMAAEDLYRSAAVSPTPTYFLDFAGRIRAAQLADAAAALRIRTDLGLPSPPPDSPAPSTPSA